VITSLRSISARAAPAPASLIARAPACQGQASDRDVPPQAKPRRARFRGYLGRHLPRRQRGDGGGRHDCRPHRRDRLRCHLLARRPRPRRQAAHGIHDRQGQSGHHCLAGPSGDQTSRPAFRHRPQGARIFRRLAVAGDGDAQADVAETASAAKLGEGRLSLRSRRFPDLEGDRLARTFPLHADRQVELSRPRKPRLECRLPSRLPASKTCSKRAVCRTKRSASGQVWEA
jgi:hypothetical protein